MTNKQHTKEPWKVFLNENRNMFLVIPSNELDPDIEVADFMNNPEDEANAKRIVECVNFCAGFTSAQLKDMGGLKRIVNLTTHGLNGMDPDFELPHQWHPLNLKDKSTWPDGTADVLVYGKKPGNKTHTLDTTGKRTIRNYNFLEAWADIGATHYMKITPPETADE